MKRFKWLTPLTGFGFTQAVNGTYNNSFFTIGVSAIGRLKQLIIWRRDCVKVVNVWTEYKPILENCRQEILIDLLMNIILLIRVLFSNFRILLF